VRGVFTFAVASLLALASATSRASEPVLAAPEAPAPSAAYDPDGDLFPTSGRLSLSAGTGLPFLGIGEVGVGITRGFAIGVLGGVTPSVLTAGIRPRVRVRLGDHLALMLVVPMLYYPSASAPGPGNIGSTSWVLARAELSLDATITERFHLAGGMGIIAAASTLALANRLEGKAFVVPGYGMSAADTEGFAGGLWNTVCFHASYAVRPRTHLFAEGSLVMSGVVPAENVGGPPLVVTMGVQQTF
jgi:hypothetical protein